MPVLNRRSAIQAGIALPLVASLPGRIAGANEPDNAVLQLERVVFDVRFSESYEAAQAIAGHGVDPAPIADDLMRLWYDELDLQWKASPMTLGGIALPETLFVLETFALDRGMQVVFRGEHAVAEGDSITHSLQGPQAMLEQFAHAARSESWPLALAHAMRRCPAEPAPLNEMSVQTKLPAQTLPQLRSETLVSWIIAPRNRHRSS